MALSESNPDADSEVEGDGRTRRRVRNREKVVEALYELIGEGHRRPTADQVAARAGVGRRTVFRHFDDLESLFAELARQVLNEAQSGRKELDPGGSLEVRLEQLVAGYAALFEKLTPFRRSNQLHAWRSPVLQRFDREAHEHLRAGVSQALPELADESAAIRASLFLLLSPKAWDGLREDQGVDAKAAEEALLAAARRLLLSR